MSRSLSLSTVASIISRETCDSTGIRISLNHGDSNSDFGNTISRYTSIYGGRDLIQTNARAERKNGRLNSGTRRDHKLLRESGRFFVDVYKRRNYSSFARRVKRTGRWIRITNDAVAGKKGRASSSPCCSLTDPYRYYPAYSARRTTFIKLRATCGKPSPEIQSADA